MPLWARWPHQTTIIQRFLGQVDVCTDASILKAFESNCFEVNYPHSHLYSMLCLKDDGFDMLWLPQASKFLFYFNLGNGAINLEWCHIPPSHHLVLQEPGSCHSQVATTLLRGSMKCSHGAPYFERALLCCCHQGVPT